MSQRNLKDPTTFERVNYIHMLQGYQVHRPRESCARAISEAGIRSVARRSGSLRLILDGAEGIVFHLSGTGDAGAATLEDIQDGVPWPLCRCPRTMPTYETMTIKE